MVNRRGFLGALAGMPIAAVVLPKVSVPEVTAAPDVRTIGYHWVDEAARPGRHRVTVTVTCDTREFEREVARAQRVVDAVGRRLERAAQRIPIRVERGRC